MSVTFIICVVISILTYVTLAAVKLIYLPPYCPELNPIEMCFSVVKSRFKRNLVLEIDHENEDWVIQEHIGDCITPQLIARLYDNCGYALPPEIYQELG